MGIDSFYAGFHTAGFATGSSRKARIWQRYQTLREHYQQWFNLYKLLSEYSQPYRGKFLAHANSKGSVTRNKKMIDNAALLATNTLQAGLLSSLTSPARPWFRLRTADRSLMENDSVKNWLDECAKVCREVLRKSNFYTEVGNIYSELAIFGTAVMYNQPAHAKDAMVFRSFTAGEYMIAENEFGDVDTVVRLFTMTAGQLVERFLRDPINPEYIHWEKATPQIQTLWKNKQFDTDIPVIHIIQPRRKRDKTKIDQMNMPFESVYIELAGQEDTILHEGGYQKFPMYVPRWRVMPQDIYGRSPMMDCLNDSIQLQVQQLRHGQAIEKMADPPLVGAAELEGNPTSSQPSDITYVHAGDKGVSSQLAPLYLQTPAIRELSEDMEKVRMRINEAMYKPLFAQFVNNNPEGDKMTAAEVAQRNSERLVLLAPTLQNLNTTLLSPVIKTVFAWAGERGLLPPLPDVLLDAPTTDGVISIEYISMLAQAQEAVAANALERTYGFLGIVMGADSEVGDWLDGGEALKQYARIAGVDEAVIRDKEVVDGIRAQRAQQQALQQAAEMAQPASQAAKNLSETQTGGQNALNDILGGGVG